MNREQWNDFLAGMASEVHALILHPENLQAFRENIRPFIEQWQAWSEAQGPRPAEVVMAEAKRDWRKAKQDARLRDREHPPEQGKWRWDNACGLEFIERDGVRHVKMPACLGAEYVKALSGMAERQRKRAQGLPAQGAQKRRATEGAKSWKRFAEEVKAELAREAKNPTGDLLLTHPWWQCWPDTARQYKAGVLAEEVARIEQTIGEHIGCWRPERHTPRDVAAEWFSGDSLAGFGRAPGELPELAAEEERQRRYVVLAAIHDQAQTGNKIAPDEMALSVLATAVWSWVNPCHPDGFARCATFVRCALADVRRELGPATPKAEAQKPQPAGSSETPMGDALQRPADWKECDHTADFTWVRWYGAEQQFNKTQAKCVSVLWNEWEKNPEGKAALHQKTIQAQIGSENADFRLVHVFRHRSKQGIRVLHDAWGTMIHSLGRGKFYLAKPTTATITTVSNKRPPRRSRKK